MDEVKARIKFGPLYADRDPSELEPWYSQHVNAMTAEGLHNKSDIAAELAHRDRQIRELSDALAWTAQRLRDVLASRPVRDATECLANADRLTGSEVQALGTRLLGIEITHEPHRLMLTGEDSNG